MPTINRDIKGFSLLELSIVLVIIGLIAGGIVAGSSMIRAAELRSIITEQEQYKTAIYTFRDKYLGLPGDLKNAVRFWGAAAGTTVDGADATCIALDHTSPSTGTETCNGDGDGGIGITGSSERWERYRFWQQLANAGLISGSFTGVTGEDSAFDAEPGINVPEAKMVGGGFATRYFTGTYSSTTMFPSYYGQILYFGAAQAADTTNDPILTSEEAWNIDTKLDDGKVTTGTIMGFKNSKTPDCTTTDDETTAEYDLINKTIACSLIIKMGF